MNVANLEGEQLDYWMYCHACKACGETAAKATFDEGYAQGRYRFSSDRALLADLMETYQINLQRLAGEWLASTAGNSYYGDTPLLASCRLVVALSFGKTVEG